MQPITNSLINSIRKAAKFLYRDFLELEMLQKRQDRNEEFCKKSYLKLKGLLQDELKKHTEYLFFPEDQFDINNENSDIVFLVNPIDSSSNFARSIPFFALSITCLRKMQDILTPISTVIYFPVFNEIYYAEKGKGAWTEKNNLGPNHQGLRLRVSDNADLKNSLIAIDNITNSISSETDIRIFGSPCYAATLLASGKVDILSLSFLNFTLYYALELVIKEAGGMVVDSTDKFVASNRYIAKQLKNVE